jgi:hypothetical protein
LRGADQEAEICLRGFRQETPAMSSSQATAAASKFGRIGLDLGMFGRIARLLLGTAMIARISYELAMSNPGAAFLAEAALYFVLSLLA